MESERQKKILLLKVLVISIIAIIFILWIFNFKNVWRPVNFSGNQNQASSTELIKFKEDINKQMTEINQRLNDISDQKKAAQNQAGNELLNNLIKETGKATSTATSTATSSPLATSSIIKNSNCPAYINCMPSIGEARPCIIPAGCEGITQIAY